MHRIPDETESNVVWSLKYAGTSMRVTKETVEVSIVSTIYTGVSSPCGGMVSRDRTESFATRFSDMS